MRRTHGWQNPTKNEKRIVKVKVVQRTCHTQKHSLMDQTWAATSKRCPSLLCSWSFPFGCWWRTLSSVPSLQNGAGSNMFRASFQIRQNGRKYVPWKNFALTCACYWILADWDCFDAQRSILYSTELWLTNYFPTGCESQRSRFGGNCGNRKVVRRLTPNLG